MAGRRCCPAQGECPLRIPHRLIRGWFFGGIELPHLYTRNSTQPYPVRGTSQGGTAADFTSSLTNASLATSHPAAPLPPAVGGISQRHSTLAPFHCKSPADPRGSSWRKPPIIPTVPIIPIIPIMRPPAQPCIPSMLSKILIPVAAR